MYKIIGGDHKEYGPISGEQLHEWIQQGRANAQTLAQAENQIEWKPLITFSEFAEALAAKPLVVTPPFSAPGASGMTPEILERDYDLDLGRCVSRGWELLQKNMGLLIGATAIYAGIEFTIGLLGAIPLIGAIFSLLNLFVAGPLAGGLFYVLLQTIRGQPATCGDVFEGFRRSFLQLVLGYIVSTLLAGLCFLPVGVVGFMAFMPSLTRQEDPGMIPVLITVVAGLVCLVPMIFLSVNWMFTVPLIVDKRMQFWSAMQTSWTMVRKHWWQLFTLALLVVLMNIAGTLLCCVGVLFSLPIGIAALMYAYETIYRP